MARKIASKTVIYAALAGNALVAATKLFAAGWTGSAAMLAEAVHSMVDTGNEALLLYGLHRARRAPSAERPFGYGREIYFWSFIVALMIFTLGAVVAVLEGIFRILNPRPVEDVHVVYIVIALAFLFEGASWWFAVRTIRAAGAPDDYIDAFRRSKDPASFLALFEDTAALLGLVVALVGTWAASNWRMPVFDGAASILIGVILGVTALFLTKETKSLLIGEPADAGVVESISRLARQDYAVVRVNAVLTAQLAPDQIVALLSVEFADDLTTSVIESKVAEMEDRVRAAHPQVVTLFIKPQTPTQFAKIRDLRGYEKGRAPGSS
jgi:cation diffusion facilitator family transporter